MFPRAWARPLREDIDAGPLPADPGPLAITTGPLGRAPRTFRDSVDR